MKDSGKKGIFLLILTYPTKKVKILILRTLVQPNKFIVLCHNKLAGEAVEEKGMLAVQISTLDAAQHAFAVQMCRNRRARKV